MSAAKEQKVRRGRRETAEARRAQILQVSRELIADEGFESFSLRKVASNADIHLKTLQYYFPARETLITATLESTYALYRGAVEEICREEASDLARFESYIRYLLKDHGNKHTAGFFYHLWARAHTDPATNEMMDRMYENHNQTLEALIRPLVPGLKPDQHQRRATMIAALVEGMMLFIGYGKRRKEGTENIEDDVIAECTHLATQQPG